MKNSDFDIYQMITDRIIEELENGTIPWRKPWFGRRSGAISYTTQKPYSFINQIMIGEQGEFITFNQVKALKGQVKKGAKSKVVVFWKIYKKTETDDTCELKEKTIPVLKYYRVFNISDCTGIKPKTDFTKPPQEVTKDEQAELIASNYINKYNISFSHESGDRAYYRPSTDDIVLPMLDQFAKTSEYYSTLFHELTHSTGHETRLNRPHTGRGDKQSYAKEELIAEIGASAIVNYCNLETPDSFKNNAGYIQSWLRALKDDKKLIVSASGKADKAVTMILDSGETDDEQ